MAPPRAVERSYHALPGGLGQVSTVPEMIRIDGIEIADGFLERGLVEIVFERDGTSESAEVLLSDEDGNAISIEIAPLADTVRIHREAL
jgi:hypothetical protein